VQVKNHRPSSSCTSKSARAADRGLDLRPVTHSARIAEQALELLLADLYPRVAEQITRLSVIRSLDSRLRGGRSQGGATVLRCYVP